MSGQTSQNLKTIITPEIKEQVKNRTSLVDLIRPQVPDLKKKGKYFWGCCPFHHEKTPSFHVREAEGTYYCFGCGASGDAITYVQETQGVEFPEAIKILAERVGIQLQYEEVDPEAQKQKEDGYAVLEAATSFFASNLPKSPSYSYITENRALNKETIQTFELGHAVDDWRTLYHHLKQAGFSDDIIQKAGLCKTSDKGGEPFDIFRNRLIFPIRDLKDRVVGFGGRRLSSDENAGPKYLNSADTPFFNKGFTLYNLNKNADIIRRTGQALLVEGYMDVIALWQAGIHTAVAPLGTAVTGDQISLLWRYCSSPIVCLDGDSAGQSAAVRAAKRALPILEPGKTLLFSFLEDNEDPDTYIKKFGREAFLKVIQTTKTLEEVLWIDLIKDVAIQTADGQAQIDAHITELMNDVNNTTLKTHLRRALKDRLWKATRGEQASNNWKKQQAQKPATAKRGWMPKLSEDTSSRQMLSLVCAYPELLDEFEENLFELSFTNQEDKQVLNEIIRLLTHEGVAPSELKPYLLESAAEYHVQHLIHLVPAKLSQQEAKESFLRIYRHQKQSIIKQQHKQKILQNLNSDLTPEMWEKMKELRKKRQETLSTNS